MKWMQQAVYAMRARPCFGEWLDCVSWMYETIASTERIESNQSITRPNHCQPKTCLERAREAHAEGAEEGRKEEAGVELQSLRGRVLPRERGVEGLLQNAPQRGGVGHGWWVVVGGCCGCGGCGVGDGGGVRMMPLLGDWRAGEMNESSRAPPSLPCVVCGWVGWVSMVRVRSSPRLAVHTAKRRQAAASAGM